ncbi:hypothetical protein [Halothece sp. PCC 7418]|uniref:hypothetical protein n=1 Tax=Halothece sp. (strain PCC 7418) TaxID=65093 RepID=UPI0002D57D95|nr:hypothetical protein [Halothece sp. PCC 7418]
MRKRSRGLRIDPSPQQLIAPSLSFQNSDRAFPLILKDRSRSPSHPKSDVAKPRLYEHRAKIAIKS